MAQCLIARQGGSGGVGSDELTATLSDVIKGKTAVTSDSNDEAGTGTLELTGNAEAGDVLNGKTFYGTDPKSKQAGTLALSGNAEAKYVYNGKTFYSTDPKSKQTGTMTVSSVVSFSVAVSGITFTLKWQNPSKGPYGGVIIRVKEGSYPTSVSDGTQAYKGTGSNSAINGQSTASWTASKQSTTYYFRIWMYCDTSQGTLYSGSKDASGTTGKLSGSQTFKSSGTFTVPTGVTQIKVFVVGGGGSGSAKGGGGGGGGYTKTGTFNVSPGAKYAVTIGAGGAATGSTAGNAGGTTSFGSLISAGGGAGAPNEDGGNGGSGGGPGGYASSSSGSRWPACLHGRDGGSNGGNGESNSKNLNTIGYGQGSTTRAYGESSGTLYAGGGGGGGDNHGTDSSYYNGTVNGGAGGSGGGGAGAGGNWAGGNGSANTGGGGGGGGSANGSGSNGGAGGSGLCLVKWG